jgi:hypothetical protein
MAFASRREVVMNSQRPTPYRAASIPMRPQAGSMEGTKKFSQQVRGLAGLQRT